MATNSSHSICLAPRFAAALLLTGVCLACYTTPAAAQDAPPAADDTVAEADPPKVELPPLINLLVVESLEREREDCENLYIEWIVHERRSPAFAPPNVRDMYQVPEKELRLERTYKLVLRGDECRFDENGEIIASLPNEEGEYVSLVARREAVKMVTEQFAISYSTDTAFQFETGRKFHGDGMPPIDEALDRHFHYNEVSLVPMYLFARPSRVSLFKSIQSGEYVDNSTPDEQAKFNLSLTDQTGTRTLKFDSRRSHNVIGAKVRDFEIDIEYWNFEDFGPAPSTWTVTKRDADGQPIRQWIARVTECHRDMEKIDAEFDYQFPAGTTVYDQGDFDKPLTATEDGRLVPKEPDEPENEADPADDGA